MNVQERGKASDAEIEKKEDREKGREQQERERRDKGKIGG